MSACHDTNVLAACFPHAAARAIIMVRHEAKEVGASFIHAVARSMMLVRHKINESGACFVEAIRRSTVTLHQDMTVPYERAEQVIRVEQPAGSVAALSGFNARLIHPRS